MRASYAISRLESYVQRLLIQEFLVCGLILIFLLLRLPYSYSQNIDKDWFEQNYSKVEKYIPMRDGVKLYTSIYIPKDQSSKHPILMERSPYSCKPYGPDEFRNFWSTSRKGYAKEKFILVRQDVRGKFMSEGDFVEVRPFNKDKKDEDIDEASDSYDTIEWLVKNIQNNSGKVGVIGTSYPGFYAAQAALSGHPALVAVSPQAPVTDWFMGDDWHHNGAFFMMDALNFYGIHGTPRPLPAPNETRGFDFISEDNYDAFLQAGSLKNIARLMGDSIAFWGDLYNHPDYDDWWKARNARNGFYDIKPALLWVGGLFDAEDCFGVWNSYKASELQSPHTESKLVMGPWYHGQWSHEGSFLGNVRFGSNTAVWYQEHIETPFFNYYLLGKGSVDEIAEANIFFTGENQWHTFDVWPPENKNDQDLILSADGKLTLNSSSPSSTNGANNGYDEYISDPAHPVPYTQDIHFDRTREYMTDDQRFASRRPDVLTYETGILDRDITLAGPVIADLNVSISTTDADFVVKLIDVFPVDFEYSETTKGNDKDYPMGGYQMLVRGEIMRGKYRNSFEKPEPFVPGKVTKVKWTLPDVAHTFLKGHKIMVQVQSTWFPLSDRNPQKFIDIYKADDSEFQKATVRIYHDEDHLSKIILPVLNK